MNNVAVIDHYKMELLPNGFYSVYDYQCQWSGLYHADGTHRSGSATITKDMFNALKTQLEA